MLFFLQTGLNPVLLKSWVVFAVVAMLIVAGVPWLFSARSSETSADKASEFRFEPLLQNLYAFQDEDFWGLQSWGISLAELDPGFLMMGDKKSAGYKSSRSDFRFAGRVVSGETDNRILISSSGEVATLQKDAELIFDQKIEFKEEVIYLSDEAGGIIELPLFSSDIDPSLETKR